jgi:competence ComEA-like helix-hairpin-helix protein
MIDSNRPVYLTRMIVHPVSGNVMPPLAGRTYPPGSIPERFLTPDYVRQDPPPPPELVSAEPDKVFAGDPEALPLRTIDTVAALATAADPSKVISKPKLSINTASASEIAAALDGVGEKTALNIVKAREVGPFASIEDLEKRAPLPVNRKWETLADQLSFS